eukprot:852307-Pleurochrysis_carterae.AAC.2
MHGWLSASDCETGWAGSTVGSQTIVMKSSSTDESAVVNLYGERRGAFLSARWAAAPLSRIACWEAVEEHTSADLIREGKGVGSTNHLRPEKQRLKAML